MNFLIWLKNQTKKLIILNLLKFEKLKLSKLKKVKYFNNKKNTISLKL